MNPARRGTKAAAHYRLSVKAGGSETIRLKLSASVNSSAGNGRGAEPFGPKFQETLQARRREADEFYGALTPKSLNADQANVLRQALAGDPRMGGADEARVRRTVLGEPRRALVGGEVLAVGGDLPPPLADLRRRIETTRWPEKETDQSQGVQLATMQKLASYWGTDYDWRKCEAKLKALPHFMTEIDGLDIHFIHVRSKHEKALPLIVTHGWPTSRDATRVG